MFFYDTHMRRTQAQPAARAGGGLAALCDRAHLAEFTILLLCYIILYCMKLISPSTRP